MKSNIEIIKRLYYGYQNGNAKLMAQQYSENAIFEDPIFGQVKSHDINKMWYLVVRNTTDLFLDYQIIEVSKTIAIVHWYSVYTFTHTNRKIKISVETHLRFRNGKIIVHIDEYSFRVWLKQAFGFKGLILGWNPLFKRKFRKSTQNFLQSVDLGEPDEYN